MTFGPYTPAEVSIDTVNSLEAFYGSQQPLNKGIFAALGSYWREYYRNTDILNVLETGIQQVVSQEYLNLMNMVLSSNVLNIPTQVENRFNLFVFNSSLAEYVCETGTFSFSELTGRETILYVKYPIDLNSISGIGAFVNYLLEPTVGLTSGDWFDIDSTGTGYIKFYTDIFRDPSIVQETYFSYNSNTRETFVLLWGVDVVLTSYNIYEKYGTFLYRREADSQSYKLLITALQFFYVNTKTIDNIESAINILMGMPFCISYGEVVTAIAPRAERFSNTQVVTTHNVYEAPFYSEVVVQVGDTLSVGSLVARWSIVSDYISNPDWHREYEIPYQLIDSIVNPVVSMDEVRVYYDGATFYDGSYDYDQPLVPVTVIDPFGYGSCRFPYQLFHTFAHTVEERDFSTYPTFSGALRYNSEIDYCGAEHTLIENLELAFAYAKKWYKARRDSAYEIERWLYSILDSFLRYNLIQIKTSLTLESVYYYRDVLALFSELVRGIPFYLFPNIDTVVYAIIEEEMEPPTESVDWVAFFEFFEEVNYQGSVFYDNSRTYSGLYEYDVPGTLASEDTLLLTIQPGFIEHAKPGGLESIPGLIYYDGSSFYDGAELYYTEASSTTEDEFVVAPLFSMEEPVEEPTEEPVVTPTFLMEEHHVGEALMDTIYYNGANFYDDSWVFASNIPMVEDDEFVLNILYA